VDKPPDTRPSCAQVRLRRGAPSSCRGRRRQGRRGRLRRRWQREPPAAMRAGGGVVHMHAWTRPSHHPSRRCPSRRRPSQRPRSSRTSRRPSHSRHSRRVVESTTCTCMHGDSERRSPGRGSVAAGSAIALTRQTRARWSGRNNCVCRRCVRVATQASAFGRQREARGELGGGVPLRSTRGITSRA
jgi:hypothetical protein